MSNEQLLIAGIGTLWGALVFVCGLLWKEAKECKRDRLALRKRLENLEAENGRAKGRLEILALCRQAHCPFKAMPPEE